MRFYGTPTTFTHKEELVQWGNGKMSSECKTYRDQKIKKRIELQYALYVPTSCVSVFFVRDKKLDWRESNLPVMRPDLVSCPWNVILPPFDFKLPVQMQMNVMHEGW